MARKRWLLVGTGISLALAAVLWATLVIAAPDSALQTGPLSQVPGQGSDSPGSSILAIPRQPRSFHGDVRIGGELKGGLEIRVKFLDEGQNKRVPAELTVGSVSVTSSSDAFLGTFGRESPFAVRGDVTDTPEREGANPGERLFFYLVTSHGTGDTTTKKPEVLDATKNVDIVLEARSPGFTRGVPFLVDIIVRPNGQPVDAVDAFLDFTTGDLEVAIIEPGPALLDVLISSSGNTEGTVDYRARTRPGAPHFDLPIASEFVLATVTFKPKRPVAKTEIVFDREIPRQTTAVLGVDPVLRSLAGLDLLRLVEAATSVTPVLFAEGGSTTLNLSVFGHPRNISIEPPSPSNDPRPTFTWDPPGTGDVTGEVVSFEVRIIPDQTAFTDIGNVTTFTPDTGDFADPANPDRAHTFQVRAVGTGGRKDAVGSKFFVIDTTPPSAPALVRPASEDLFGTFLGTFTVEFEWSPSSGDVVEYLLQVTSADSFNPHLDIEVSFHIRAPAIRPPLL